MDILSKMNKALDYIEKHLENNFDYEDLARIVGCSSFHFTRMFSFIAGLQLSEYIRRRKLSQAALELQNTSVSILDIALKYGYNSPTSFNRAFQNQHGLPPKQARKKESILKCYPKMSFHVTIKGDVEMNMRLEKKNAFTVTGIKKRLPLVDGEENFAGIMNMWESISEDLAQSLEASSDGFLPGLLGVSAHNDGQHFDYYIGVTAEPASSKNAEWEHLPVPASTWAVFVAQGPLPAAIIETWKRVFAEWFPSSGYESLNTPTLEVYGDGDPSSDEYCSELWVPVQQIRCEAHDE